MTAPTYERPRGSCGSPNFRPIQRNTSSQLHDMNYNGVICIESRCDGPAQGYCKRHYLDRTPLAFVVGPSSAPGTTAPLRAGRLDVLAGPARVPVDCVARGEGPSRAASSAGSSSGVRLPLAALSPD